MNLMATSESSTQKLNVKVVTRQGGAECPKRLVYIKNRHRKEISSVFILTSSKKNTIIV